MAELVIPNKQQHKYVVGIDFGHGETSAALCELEWDKTAGQRLTDISDIDINREARLKVIPSAICRVNGRLYIGNEAFEYTTDNDGIRVCFKQCPRSLEGEAEELMIDFMRAVYNKIRENDDRLTDSNHIVYIARPSGWTDEKAKELYRQMAIKAGVPLAGLTAESRAAIFYAKSPKVNFANEITRGAIVFDLGSSTLDFTYLSDDENPVDYGYDLGASKIDRAVYSKLILSADGVSEFIGNYPEYEDALLFKARKFKEEAYSRSEDAKTIEGFTLDSIISESNQSYGEYANFYVKLRINNLQQLNDLVEDATNYQSELKKALEDFKKVHVSGKRINGVFLTGGASRMNFIRPLIAEVLDLPLEKVKIDGDNPSLTISRGIALLGTTDAITSQLVKQLKKDIPPMFRNDKMLASLINILSESVTEATWLQIKESCESWIKYGKTTKRSELKEKLEKDLVLFQKYKINSIVNSTFQAFVKNESEQIRVRMNEIISRYAPGREITTTSEIKLGEQAAINESLKKASDSIAKICDSISHIIIDIIWKVIAAILWGVFAIPYYVLKAILTSDESKRRDKAKDILKKEEEITKKLKSSIKENLAQNSSFKSSISHVLEEYFTVVIDSNLQKVMIPIE